MKILPQNKKITQDLNFRLRLDVQFDRDVQISIPFIADFFQTTNGIRFADDINDPEKGIDMDFEIERTDGADPSLASITLWNISDNIFNQIANHANAFELYAADGASDWGLLFRGTPYFSTQTGPAGGNNKSRGFLFKDDAVGGENDTATTITLIDSLHAFESATISKSYQGDISAQTIINDCATAMGVLIGDELDQYPIMNNYVARGKVSCVLREICGKIGCKYIVDNGVLHLYNGDKPKTYGFAFNANNSSRPQPEQNGTIMSHHFTTKLLPSVRAGQYCHCDFETLSGVKQIYKARLRGNNYGTLKETEVWVK